MESKMHTAPSGRHGRARPLRSAGVNATGLSRGLRDRGRIIVVGASVVACVAVLSAAARTWRADPLGRARSLVQDGRFAEADRELAGVPPTSSPGDRLLRAQVGAAVGRLDEAIAELGHIPDSDALGALARLTEGQLQARLGRVRLAELAFRRTLELLPNCLQAHRELVYIYSVQQRIPEADSHLASLAALGSLDLKHLLHWGMLHHAIWLAENDLPSLRHFVEADPEDLRSRCALVRALIKVNRLDEAAMQAARLGEEEAETFAIKAEVADARGDLEELERLLADGPEKHPVLARLRGSRALARRDLRAAIRHFSIARDLRPDDRASLFGLGSALQLSGRGGEAEPLLGVARRMDRLFALFSRAEACHGEVPADLERALGIATSELGRIEEGRAWLRRAITQDPTDGEAQLALSALPPGGPMPRPARD
ncbi:Tetratricopeptide repeat protein [Aquisphaera giovannonii]|uniref:Tetratricopeptide repeat protein n=1 Tax=Aquisphaera giovannonii TaxID=406548 RepID=A0A5B9W193_9BACT|nr:tetratricopeptide repeat protein [Aquisphaera giovannonii]QEH34027.1 Tetratricopeptide repeat protein [Aquisphaera giovannonii]